MENFKKSKDGLKIGSLLLWCKEDNKEMYNAFMKRQKLNNVNCCKISKR